MWQIIKRKKKWLMWQSRDAEGRKIYAVRAATGEMREPRDGHLSQKAALEQAQWDIEVAAGTVVMSEEEKGK